LNFFFPFFGKTSSISFRRRRRRRIRRRSW